jgi:hypothetical protein
VSTAHPEAVCLRQIPRFTASEDFATVLPNRTPSRAMKSRIESFGRIRKEFPPRGNLQLFQLVKPATFTCSVRKIEVTSGKIALDLRARALLSKGAYGQIVAGLQPLP